MGVAAQILDHLGRSAEGRLGVDHPFGLADRRQVLSEGGGIPQGFQIGEELEFAVGISLFESLQKEAAEQAAEYPHGEKETRQASLPLPVGGEAAAGNHAVQVGMQMQVLPPGVQHGEETDLRAQVFGVAGDGEQGSGHGAEQDLVDDFFVVEGDGGDLFRHGEDHVEVLHRQQFGEALLDPALARQPLALGTMAIAAGAIHDARVLAVVAPFDGAAQRGGTAVLDGLHQAVLMQGQGMRLPVGGAVLSKDVGQLGSRLGHGRARLGTAVDGSDFWPGPAAQFLTGLQVIQGALGVGDELRGDGGVVGGGVDALMAEQDLDDADIGAVFQQVGGEAVAQGVDGDVFADAGPVGRPYGRPPAGRRE